MKEIKLTKEEMDAARQLAEANMLVSEAKNKMVQVKKNITEEVKEVVPVKEIVVEKEKVIPMSKHEISNLEKTLSREHMDSVTRLAETNILISEAKNNLFKVQADQASYLIKREEEVTERIGLLYKNSSSLLQTINTNYADVKIILGVAQEATWFLKEMQKSFSFLLEEFEEKNKDWKKEVDVQQETFINLKKGIDIEKVSIENEKKTIESIKLQMIQDRRKIEDDRGTLERAFKRLNK